MFKFILKIPKQMPMSSNCVPLTHPNAAQMARDNVASQAANDYFDAELEFWFNNALFLTEGASDAWKLIKCLFEATDQRGEHNILFLDSSLEMTVFHDAAYEFQYINKRYEWDENNFLIGFTEETISSGPLPKLEVESAVKKLFIEFADFILQHNIPIAEYYLQEMKERKQRV